MLSTTKYKGFRDEISVFTDSSLDREVTVLSNDGYSYVEEEIEILISETNTTHFITLVESSGKPLSGKSKSGMHHS